MGRLASPSVARFRFSSLTFPRPFLLLLPLLQLTASDNPIADPVVCPALQADFNCPSIPAELASTFKVLVPNRTSFKELVDCSDSSDVKGFSIDVFEAARSYLMQRDAFFTNVSYTCFNFHSGASYSDMLNCLSLGYFDAVVGDVTISAERLKNATSTLPYLNSRIVLLAPTVKQTRRFPEILLKPFSAQMWCAVCAYAIITGFVMWILEHDMHAKVFQGTQKRQAQKAWWFIASSLFFFKRHTTRNPLANIVLIGWFGFVLALGSIYVAALTASLTVPKLPPVNLSIPALQSGSFKVGYQKMSVVKDYLAQKLHIPDKRLVGLSSRDAFAEALSKGPFQAGGVAAIVDEVPYVNLFLSGLPTSRCSYQIVDSTLTNKGLGFMFPVDAVDLSRAFSSAILNLKENGELQKLQSSTKLTDYRCPTEVHFAQLDFVTSQCLLLFLALAVVCYWTIVKHD